MNNALIAIETNNLSRCFGKRIALDNLNIVIRQGEIFSLLGTNGAGKTTTIKMLCCLLRPTSGNASIMGFDCRKNSHTIKGIIGVSPQDTAIAGHLSVLENLWLMGGVSGLKRSESNVRAKKLMGLMELENRKDQSRKLSGGLQRRLSIAMALMSDPQILFLDEPTLGLDPHARKSVWDYILKLKKEKTILLTTHYLEEADSLADHIAIMDKGRLIESGTSTELKSKHTNKQVLKIMTENISTDTIERMKNQSLVIHRFENDIEIHAQEIDIYGIIDILKQNKVKISGIQTQEPTLDDVFLQLTGKGKEA